MSPLRAGRGFFAVAPRRSRAYFTNNAAAVMSRSCHARWINDKAMPIDVGVVRAHGLVCAAVVIASLPAADE